jgi:hypothetical protein
MNGQHGNRRMPRSTKKNLALLKQNVNISKEDMEDYNWAMFTHTMDFLKQWVSLKKSIPNIFTQAY